MTMSCSALFLFPQIGRLFPADARERSRGYSSFALLTTGADSAGIHPR